MAHAFVPYATAQGYMLTIFVSGMNVSKNTVVEMRMLRYIVSTLQSIL